MSESKIDGVCLPRRGVREARHVGRGLLPVVRRTVYLVVVVRRTLAGDAMDLDVELEPYPSQETLFLTRALPRGAVVALPNLRCKQDLQEEELHMI